MKKFITACAIVSMGFLSACGGSDEPAPRETVFVTEETTPSEPEVDAPRGRLSQEDAFIEVLNVEVPDTRSVDNATLLDLGYSICELLDSDPTVSGVEQAAQNGIDAGVNAYDVGVIMGASIGAFCPEHSDLIDEFGNKYGAGSST